MALLPSILPPASPPQPSLRSLLQPRPPTPTPLPFLHCFFLPQAIPQMQKSTVVDGSTGKSVPSEIRTSSGTFFRVGQDPVIEDIERRIAEFTMIPQENGEGIQILKYEHGQKYEVRNTNERQAKRHTDTRE